MLVIDSSPVDGGEAELRRLLAAAPDDPALKSWLGYYLSVWGTPPQRDEGLELLQGAVRVKADDAQLQANLGWGAYQLGRDGEARQALEKALAIDDGRQLERLRLAVVLQHAGESATALADARAALAAKPAAPWAEEARKLIAELEAAIELSQR
jgi:tetratricopeptide (TPR) repeat protein